jgi:hypothetical protein
MPPRKPPGHPAGYRLVFAGLLLIAVAPALDMYLDLTPHAARHALPDVLVPAYEQAGRVGVVGSLVSLGVVGMLWGFFLQAAGTSRPARRPAGTRLMRALGAEVPLESARYVRGDQDE